MSKDIRSFFSPKINGKAASVKPVPSLSDEDVIPDSPDIQIKPKKKEAKKRTIFDDSSDEEAVDKKTKSSESSKGKSQSKKPKKNEKPKLKEVKASDIFGSEKIKRTEPIVKSKKKLKTETGIHSDEDLEKTLLELDLPEENTLKESPKKVGKSKTTVSEKSLESKSLEEKNVKSTPEKSNSSESKYFENKKLVEKSEQSKHNDSTPKLNKNERPDKHAKTPKAVKKEVINGNKKIFAEFIDDTIEKISDSDDHDTKQIKSRKRKHDNTLNETVISDEERYEKKRHSAALYQSYLNRSGPKHLGSKEMPVGAPDCLKDCAILLTGVLDSFERDEIVEAITKYGGSVKNSISKKVTHVLAGEEAGPAKLAKANELKIKIISEDDFLQMIKESLQKRHKSDVKTSGNAKEGDIIKIKEEKSKTPKKPKTPIKMEELEAKVQKSFYGKKESHKSTIVSPKKEVQKLTEKILNDDQKAAVAASLDTNNQMWVDKYKPQDIKQIIGQHGESSNVKKLMNWLTKWYMSRKEKIAKPSPWSKNDDGGYFKAALLSGPPGVGKTTTVSLVCKELGFDMVEFNASDTRSKTLITEQISELLTTSSLSGFAKGAVGKQAVTKKHVLVMDEVDGMAGNEDRGGLQTLISLIKTTSVPIICMCNDRNSTKMRSLVNYCYDLKFSKPRLDQIKGAMLSVCFKEGLKISSETMTQIITEAQQDIRQVLNSLYMWSVNCKTMDFEQVKKDSASARKDIKLGPWEVVRKIFTHSENKSMSIHDKLGLFFYDYSIGPLFVQENYVNVRPRDTNINERLRRISQAADSISMGDVIEKKIRSQNNWSLLSDQAIFSTVIPGHVMSGTIERAIQFPSWLGKNSSQNKMQRLGQEIHAHTRLTTTGSKTSIFLDYCTYLRDAIVMPLIKDKVDGIPKAMEVLKSYNLLREDLDSLTMLSLWSGQKDPMDKVEPKVKAAMTRAYNKEAMALPYAPATVKKGRGTNYDEDNEDDEQDDDDDKNDSNPEDDAMIKKRKKAPEKENKPSTSKGAGKKGSKTKKS